MTEAREPPYPILSKTYTFKGSCTSKEQESKEKFFHNVIQQCIYSNACKQPQQIQLFRQKNAAMRIFINLTLDICLSTLWLYILLVQK